MNYEALLEEADSNNLYVIENCDFESQSKGLIYNDVIGLSKKLTLSEKTCVLAEELGHYHMNVGNILDLNILDNSKQEYIARLWSYNKLIGLMGIVNAYEAGCRTKYDMAQYLDVSEEFLEEAIDTYKSKYGVCTTIDNYTIYFIPTLGVMKML